MALTVRRSAAAFALVVAVTLALPAISAGKRNPPPPPPPDSAADCIFVAEASVPDYLVIASINIGVSCATQKQSITVSAELTRDGVALFVLPLGSAPLTCTNASSCFIGYDLFSIDTVTIAAPGSQRYCATGSGLVGGTLLGPATACEEDDRL